MSLTQNNRYLYSKSSQSVKRVPKDRFFVLPVIRLGRETKTSTHVRYKSGGGVVGPNCTEDDIVLVGLGEDQGKVFVVLTRWLSFIVSVVSLCRRRCKLENTTTTTGWS